MMRTDNIRTRAAFGLSAAVCALPFAFGGTATAARQVWLQHLPPEQVPQCGPDLFFMLENFPLSRALQTLFIDTGKCAVIAIALYALWLAVGTLRRSKTF